MKKFEIIVGIIALLAIILKLLHIVGSGILTVLTLSTLSIFYYLSFALFNNIRLRDIFKSSSYKETNVKRIIGAIGLGFGLSTILIGMLFKIQFYPGAMIQLGTGLVFTGIIFIIAVIFYFRSKTDYFKRIFMRIFIIGGLGLLIYLTPKSTLIDIYYRNYPSYATALKNANENPDDKELWEIVRQEKEKMDKERENE